MDIFDLTKISLAVGTACDDALQLSQSVALTVILGMKIVFCILGILVSLHCVARKGIKWLVNANAKVIFIFHMGWTALIPFFYAAIYMNDIQRLPMVFEHSCIPSYTMDLQILPAIGILAQSYTMLALAVERVISTAFASSYEKITRPFLGVFLGLTAAILAVLVNYFFLFKRSDWNTPLKSILKTSENAVYYKIYLILFIVVEITTLVLFFAASNISKCLYKRLIASQLSNKYQLLENRKVIRGLIPMFGTHFALNALTAIAVALYSTFYPTSSTISATIFVEIFSQLQLYSLFMPLILDLRARFCRSNSVVDHNLPIDVYFTELKKWFKE